MRTANLIICTCFLAILAACTAKTTPDTEGFPHSVSPPSATIPIEDEPSPVISGATEETICFDASVEPVQADLTIYEELHGHSYYSFDAPVFSPYIYTYSGEETDIDRVAYILGEMYIEDMKNEHDGQSFTITTVYEFSTRVWDEDEVTGWLAGNLSSANVILTDNQWLCDYFCRYDYIGFYGAVGPLQNAGEHRSLITDGSGEVYHWIIQKTDENTYIMRALPRLLELSSINKY